MRNTVKNKKPETRLFLEVYPLDRWKMSWFDYQINHPYYEHQKSCPYYEQITTHQKHFYNFINKSVHPKRGLNSPRRRPELSRNNARLHSAVKEAHCVSEERNCPFKERVIELLNEHTKRVTQSYDEGPKRTLPVDYKLTNKTIIKAYAKRMEALVDGTLKVGEEDIPQKHSMVQLAEMGGCSSQTIKDIIQGKHRSINISLLNRISSSLGCSSYYLLGLSDSPYATCIDSRIFRLPIDPARKVAKDYNINDAVILDAYQLATIAQNDNDLYCAFLDATHLNEEEKEAICLMVSIIKRAHYD